MHDDTHIGGSLDRFPVTRHSIVAELGHADASVRGHAMGAVIQTYWKPVYTYLRLKHRLDNETAKDLTQGFFTHVLEKRTLDAFDPSRARFRTWVRTCLDAWAANQHQSDQRQKRGGGAQHLSLDFATADGELQERHLAVDADVELFFEREWARHLFSLAIADVHADCVRRGRDVDFAIFQRYDLEGPDAARPLRYADLAAEFGIPVTRVTNTLHAVRGRVRTALLERLRAICVSQEEFLAEAQDFFGGRP